jgi:hypothetical protein
VQIGNAGGFAVPQRLGEAAKAAGFPDVVVMLLPFGPNGPIPGNLESLCLQARSWQPTIRHALASYVASTPTSKWDKGKQAKMKAQCIVSATCQAEPEVSFAHHWQQDAIYRVPLADACFNRLSNFLANFGNLL